MDYFAGLLSEQMSTRGTLKYRNSDYSSRSIPNKIMPFPFITRASFPSFLHRFSSPQYHSIYPSSRTLHWVPDTPVNLPVCFWYILTKEMNMHSVGYSVVWKSKWAPAINNKSEIVATRGRSNSTSKCYIAHHRHFLRNHHRSWANSLKAYPTC